MPMNPNFLCCIGAELKNSTQQTTRMSQVYLYRSFEDDTLSDMLSAGFFNAAMGIIRQDDLLLLYSPNETTAKYAYARVSSVSSSGVVIKQIGIDATGISVDTTGYSNLSGNNLQEILNNLDTMITTINNAFVRKDGSSIMTGPLKFRAGSFEGAIAGGLGDGISVYKLKADGSIDSEVASLTKTNGFVPGTNNAMNIGNSALKWKDAYITRVITAVLNNGYDIAVPPTNSADTLALKSQVDDAANSGEQLYTTGVWYAKMYSASVVPSGAEYDGKNYADFSQVDNNNNPIVVIYEGQSGSWVEIARITPPANHVAYLTITSKIWDIAEQTDQQGGEVLWSYNQKTFTPYPKIVSLLNQANTDLSNLTSTGKANISKQGTYDPNETYNAGTVGEAITGKADTSLNNVSAGIDFVVESQLPTAQNNYTWYRKYKSGWVEQGGVISVSVTANTTQVWSKTLPIPMSDTNYTALVSNDSNHTLTTLVSCEGNTSTVITGFATSTDSVTCKISWYVSGTAAS